MNWVDLVVLAMLGFAVLSGYRRGAVMQVFSWGGFLVGIVIGGIVGPPLVRAINPSSPGARAITGLITFLGIAFIVEALIAFGGSRVSRKITGIKLKKADAIAGSAIAAILSMLSAYMLSVPATRVPELAPAIKGSAIMRAAYAVLPAPPDVLASIGRLLGRTGFPEVFAQFNPSLAPGVEPAPASLRSDREVLAAAKLTYKIESDGCGGRVDGSGFPAKPSLVITAAHVVAGTHNTSVQAADGPRLAATVVYLDTKTDIAVLRVQALPAAVLTVNPNEAKRGTDGAAIGYPGGGPRRITVARVRTRTQALGFDIYSKRKVEREIYVLRARVRQGNSGGPLVDTDGHVRGMIFAASSQDDEESYALSEGEILKAIENAGTKSAQVATGECAV